MEVGWRLERGNRPVKRSGYDGSGQPFSKFQSPVFYSFLVSLVGTLPDGHSLTLGTYDLLPTFYLMT